MTRQEIREKASEFVSTRASGMPKEMDYYAEILTEFATEVTKELENELATSEHDREHNDYELVEAYKKVEQLEKENAELTDKNKALEQYADLADAKVDEVKDNLTKAKEIIKELVRVEYTDFTNSDYSNELSKVLEKAEQFLKEE